MTSAARSAPYQPSLDGLRACSVLGVIALHLQFRWLPGGGIGVFIFFTLSGYLITHLLLREQQNAGRVDLRLFYARRALRLFPALALVIIAAATYSLLCPSSLSSETLVGIPAVLLYLGNWALALGNLGGLGLLGHTWSLAVEEQFYLLWPLILIASVRRNGAVRLLQVAVTCAVVSALLRLELWDRSGQVRMYGTDAIADQILWGCALAAGLHAASSETTAHLRRGVRIAGPIAAVFLIVIALTAHTDTGATRGFWLLQLPFVGVASALLIGWLSLQPRNLLARVLASPPLAALGRISYGVYLWHLLVIGVISPRLHVTHPIERVAVVAVVSIALAACSWFLVERPALRFKQRLHPAQTAPERRLASS